jgi:hypothetical protein
MPRDEDKSVAKINQQDAAKRRSLLLTPQARIVSRLCKVPFFSLSRSVIRLSGDGLRAPLQNGKRRQENGDRTLLPASPFALCHASKLINAESGVIDRLCSSNISTTRMRDAPRTALNANRPFHKKIAVITLILIYTILKGTNSCIICNTGETLNQNCQHKSCEFHLTC